MLESAVWAKLALEIELRKLFGVRINDKYAQGVADSFVVCDGVTYWIELKVIATVGRKIKLEEEQAVQAYRTSQQGAPTWVLVWVEQYDVVILAGHGRLNADQNRPTLEQWRDIGRPGFLAERNQWTSEHQSMGEALDHILVS